MIYLAIALGGALGSVLRYWVSTIIDPRLGPEFPWGTLFANITGCVLIGFFANLSGSESRFLGSVEGRLFFITGICGGYTTFSSFSLQTVSLLKDGDTARAIIYIVASVLICLLGVWLGQHAANLVNSSRAS